MGRKSSIPEVGSWKETLADALCQAACKVSPRAPHCLVFIPFVIPSPWVQAGSDDSLQGSEWYKWYGKSDGMTL